MGYSPQGHKELDMTERLSFYWGINRFRKEEILTRKILGVLTCQSCLLSPCLFNCYAEYIMRNAGLEEAQAGIKIAERNINHLRYVADTTLMVESEERTKEPLDESEKGE